MNLLRLARAQGLLSGGKDMSPVQMLAVAVLEREDRREAIRDQVDAEFLAIRAALLNRTPEKASMLFPQYFLPEPQDAAKALEDRVEQDDITPEISDDIEAWIAQRGGIITGGELDEGGWQ